MPLTGSCHCGRVRLTIPSTPAYLNECQCSLCFKYGARWCYFPKNQVDIAIDGTPYSLAAPAAATSTPLPGLALYMRADLGYKDSATVTAFNRCAHCGSVLFWTGTRPAYAAQPDARTGINSQLFAHADLEGVEVRKEPGPP